MEKINYLIGNERAFSQFISSLGEEKIALISHIDLDGIASAKVVSSVIEPDLILFVNYQDITLNLVEKLKKEEIKKVIFTDLSIDFIEIIKEIEKFSEVLIIDHHVPRYDFNSLKTTYINAKGYCAAFLSYSLFSKVQNLNYLDWIVACASISDMLYRQNENWMKIIFEKYGDNYLLEDDRLKKEGKFWELQMNLSLALVYFREDVKRVFDSIGNNFGDIGDLAKYADEINKEITITIDKFRREKISFKDGYFWEIKSIYPVKEMIINDLSFQEANKIFLIAEVGKENVGVSARRQDGNVNLPDFLQNLIQGFENSSSGGHIKAAGAHFPKKYYLKFKSRVGLN
jgi:oligoribonuclease NrnB/cAMP/cGMP phosphodiesterase (DHH superfamily)